jgi:hypothetical protein
MWVFSHKKLLFMTRVRSTLWFHPLQYTICGVYCGIYYIKNDHYNVQYVVFIVVYITLQWPLKCTICDIYCGIYYITTIITIYNMRGLLWHVLHYNDHYNVQCVAFIVAYITLQWPLQCTICDVYCGVYYITMTITMYNMWRLLHYNDHLTLEV